MEFEIADVVLGALVGRHVESGAGVGVLVAFAVVGLNIFALDARALIS